MATNPFQGLFSGRGTAANNAANLVKYKHQLDQFDEDEDAYKQGQAISAIMPGLEEATRGMSEERKRHIKMQMMMMRQPALFDKGAEGYASSFKQRGTTIADIQKQELGVDAANRKHKYKVENPISEGVGKKEAYTKWYMTLTDEEKIQADQANRANQWLNTATHMINPRTGEMIPIATFQKQLEEVAGTEVGQRLVNYGGDRREHVDMMEVMGQSIEELGRLDDLATNWTTGWMGAASAIPDSDARNFKNILDAVNAQTVIDTMTKLKAASQTGATGFGAVNLKELETMQDKWGKIDQYSGKEHVKEVIARRKRLLKEFIQRARGRMVTKDLWYGENQGRLPAGVLEDITSSEYQVTTPDQEMKEQQQTQGAVGKYNPITKKVEFYTEGQ